MSIDQFVPTSRLTERIVRSGLVTAWRLATSPTSTSPLRAKATMDGVVREPSALAMTVGSPPSRTLTQEFVVPRSIPTARGMVFLASYRARFRYKVEWNRLNDATGSHTVKLKLSPPDASHSTSGTPGRAQHFGRYLSGHGIPAPVVLDASIGHSLPVTTQGDAVGPS